MVFGRQLLASSRLIKLSTSVFSHPPSAAWQTCRYFSGNNKALKIFFATKRGTSRDFAKKLKDEADSKGFQSTIHDLKVYDPTSLSSEKGLAVFVLSTWHGEPIDDAIPFYDYLMQENLAEGLLKDLKFSVFGTGSTKEAERFGDSTFYMAVARAVDSRLAELGATRICNRGEGDAAGDNTADFKVWTDKLLNALQ